MSCELMLLLTNVMQWNTDGQYADDMKSYGFQSRFGYLLPTWYPAMANKNERFTPYQRVNSSGLAVMRSAYGLTPYITLGTLMTSAAADVINHNGRKIGRFKPRRFW